MSVGDDDDANVEEKLNGLQDVDHVTKQAAIKPECEIAIGAQGELERVEANEDTPKKESTTMVTLAGSLRWAGSVEDLQSSHNPENGIQSNTWTPPESAHRKPSASSQHRENSNQHQVTYGTPYGPRISVVIR